jgi:hypothetical protein
MNAQFVGYTRLTVKRLTSFVLVLVLWTGFAFIEHQLDTDKAHHEHHHCQLFSHAIHGVSSALPVLPVIIQKHFQTGIDSIATAFRTLPIEKARAPPKSSIHSS